MKKSAPMAYEPPKPKPIEELIGQDAIEKRDNDSQRYYAQSKLGEYSVPKSNPTRPDLEQEEKEGEE